MTTRRMTPERRLARNCTVEPNGCWLWTGYRNHDGYGIITVDGRTWRAHRWTYTMKYGPVPDGLVLDHYVCDTTSCVNPDHVRPVTQRENTLRSEKTQASLNLSKRECKRGHPYPEEWTGHRKCGECARQANRAYRAAHAPPSQAKREPAPVVRVDPELAERASWLFVGRPEVESPVRKVIRSKVAPRGATLNGALDALSSSRQVA